MEFAFILTKKKMNLSKKFKFKLQKSEIKPEQIFKLFLIKREKNHRDRHKSLNYVHRLKQQDTFFSISINFLRGATKKLYYTNASKINKLIDNSCL